MPTIPSWLRVEPFIITMTFAWVVGLFSAATAPLQDLWRPLLVALAASVIAALVARTSRWRWAVVGIGALWMLAIGAWPLSLGIGLIASWRLGIDLLRRSQGRNALREPAARQILRVANALGVAGLIVASISLLNSGAVVLGGASAASQQLTTRSDAPNIYLVLLDGYPSTDTLLEDFGYENGPFEAELRERGFDVATESKSNYNRTLLTLASMLHMNYIASIPELATPVDGFAGQNRQLTAAINDSPVLRMLGEAGYRSVAVASSYGEGTLASADDVIRSDTMTLFEEQLIRYTAAGNGLITVAPEFVAEQHRESIRDAIIALRKLPQTSEGKTVALVHVFSPHVPFVFNADGSPRDVHECYPERCGLTAPEANRIGLSREEYGDGLTNQVQYLNRSLLTAIDNVVAQDPNAVIVLFSDHGARFEEGPAEEHFETFFAARTPGHDGLFATSVSPVNVFPALFNAYFDASFPMREYRAAWAPDDAPLEPAPTE